MWAIWTEINNVRFDNCTPKSTKLINGDLESLTAQLYIGYMGLRWPLFHAVL